MLRLSNIAMLNKIEMLSNAVMLSFTAMLSIQQHSKAMLSNAQLCSAMLSYAQQCRIAQQCSNAQQCSSIRYNAQQYSAMLSLAKSPKTRAITRNAITKLIAFKKDSMKCSFLKRSPVCQEQPELIIISACNEGGQASSSSRFLLF